MTLFKLYVDLFVYKGLDVFFYSNGQKHDQQFKKCQIVFS